MGEAPILLIDSASRAAVRVSLRSAPGVCYEDLLSGDSTLEQLQKLTWLSDLPEFFHNGGEFRVNLGPGSFTGLRVGLAFCLGAAVGLPSITLCGFSGLLAAAASCGDVAETVRGPALVFCEVASGRYVSSFVQGVGSEEVQLVQGEQLVVCSAEEILQLTRSVDLALYYNVVGTQYPMGSSTDSARLGDETSELCRRIAHERPLQLVDSVIHGLGRMRRDQAIKVGPVDGDWRQALQYGRAFTARTADGRMREISS